MGGDLIVVSLHHFLLVDARDQGHDQWLGCESEPCRFMFCSKRRVVMDHNRTTESDGHHRVAGSGGVSSSTGPGSGRRPVRERLGPRNDESRR